MINPALLFAHYLKQLLSILEKVEQWCQGDTEILDARLHPDMLPFINQVSTTANFSLRGCCPLLGREFVSFATKETSFSGLKQQITDTLDYLTEIPANAFDQANPGELSEKAGFARVQLPAEQFIHLYILPNFYFHFSMVYAIARSRGVPLSKQDFDGLHEYPASFSFEQR